MGAVIRLHGSLRFSPLSGTILVTNGLVSTHQVHDLFVSSFNIIEKPLIYKDTAIFYWNAYFNNSLIVAWLFIPIAIGIDLWEFCACFGVKTKALRCIVKVPAFCGWCTFYYVLILELETPNLIDYNFLIHIFYLKGHQPLPFSPRVHYHHQVYALEVIPCPPALILPLNRSQ